MALKYSLDLTVLGAMPGRPAFAAARLDGEVAFATLPSDGTIDDLLRTRDRVEETFYGGNLSDEELQGYGAKLGQLLFDGPTGDLYSAARREGVRINLVINDCELQRLPWEFMHVRNEDPGPCMTRSVARIVSSGAGRPPAAVNPGRLRVLLLVSCPPNDKIVPLEELTRGMQSRFNARLERIKVDLVVHPVDSEVAITRALQDVSWDVVHFLGHGDVQTKPSGQMVGGIVVATKGGDRFLKANHLAAMFQDRQPRLLILSACSTGMARVNASFGNLAGVLVRQNIPAVLANQMVISAESVAEFASAVYDSLLKTGDIDQAVAAGRLQSYATLVSDKDQTARVEWGVPVLYRQYGAQRLFAEA